MSLSRSLFMVRDKCDSHELPIDEIVCDKLFDIARPDARKGK
jgi:hypothetical protein